MVQSFSYVQLLEYFREDVLTSILSITRCDEVPLLFAIAGRFELSSVDPQNVRLARSIYPSSSEARST